MPGTDLDRTQFLDAALRRVLDALSPSAPSRTPHYVQDSAWVRADVATPSGWDGDFYDHGNWTAGFWTGMLLELEALGAPAHREIATAVADVVRLRAEDGGTHDIGFLFQPSACLLHEVTGEARWQDDGLRAAETLARRLRPGGYLQAFGQLDDPRSYGTSTIDTTTAPRKPNTNSRRRVMTSASRLRYCSRKTAKPFSKLRCSRASMCGSLLCAASPSTVCGLSR